MNKMRGKYDKCFINFDFTDLFAYSDFSDL